MPSSSLHAVTVAVLVCGLLAAADSARSGEPLNDGETGRAAIGLQIARQNGIELDRTSRGIGRGSYLVTVGGCNDCHTWPNYTATGNPFDRQPQQVNVANYLAGGRVFALPTENVCSPNITPAPGTHNPAGLSRPAFLYVLHTGCDPQNENFRDPDHCGLLQVMPWPAYQQMAEADLNAIYDYLSALPHTEISSAAQCKPEPQGIAPQ